MECRNWEYSEDAEGSLGQRVLKKALKASMHWKHPSSAIPAWPSNCGAVNFVKSLLENANCYLSVMSDANVWSDCCSQEPLCKHLLSNFWRTHLKVLVITSCFSLINTIVINSLMFVRTMKLRRLLLSLCITEISVVQKFFCQDEKSCTFNTNIWCYFRIPETTSRLCSS